MEKVEKIANELTLAFRLIYYSSIRTTTMSEHPDMFDPDVPLQMEDNFKVNYISGSDDLKQLDDTLTLEISRTTRIIMARVIAERIVVDTFYNRPEEGAQENQWQDRIKYWQQETIDKYGRL